MANQFTQTRVPFMSLMFDNSMAGGSVKKWRTLIMGTKNDLGTATANKPCLVVDKNQGISLFGIGSVLSNQITAYKNNDTNTELWAIALEQVESENLKKAQIELKPVVVSLTDKDGKALFKDKDGKDIECISGDINLYISKEKISLNISKDKNIKDFSALCDELVLQINAFQENNPGKYLIIDAVLGKNKDKIILKNKEYGDFLNGIKLEFNLNKEEFPVGITEIQTGSFPDPTTNPTSIKANSAAVKLVDTYEKRDYFSGAKGSPDVSEVFHAIKDSRFNTFVCPYLDDATFTAFKDRLEERWEPTKQNDGVAFLSLDKDATESCDFVKKFNSQNITITNTYGIPEYSYIVNASVAAQCSASALADPAMPLSTLALSGIRSPDEFSQLSFAERSTLLGSNISTLVVVGDNVVIERMLTTYKKNNSNIDD